MILAPGLFQVFIGLDVKGSPDLTYVLYFISGTQVTAQGYTYATKAATTYELALLNPTLVNTSPMFTGNVHSTSVVLSAISGIITFFRLDSVSIRFLQAPAATGSPDPTNSREYAYYYFLFLFVIPIATTVLLVKVFRLE